MLKNREFMQINLEGKVVVVAGGGGKPGSIGQVIVSSLRAAGALAVVVDLVDRGTEGADLIVAADVTDEVQVRTAVRRIVDRYGRIDVLINNVGINDGVGLTATLAEFEASLRVNLTSYWLVTKYCFPHLQATRGNVLNIGSKVALTGQGNTSAYAASKGGVLALTREWAVDFLPYGMRSNAIVIAECFTPAYREWIDGLENGEAKLAAINGKVPLERRMTTPREIANTALFLVSDLSSHTTGQQVFVDGGYVHLDRALLTQANEA